MKTLLSPLISGTMNWGLWDKKLDQNEMSHMIHVFLEQGISTFDLADIYGGYTTEAEFGAALLHSGIARDSVQLITKCGIKQSGGERTFPVKHYDYRPEYIRWSVENSLKNLHTDHIDVLLLHRPSPLMDASEIAGVIADLQQEGKIIDFGLSNFTVSQMRLISDKIPVACNQIQFSVTEFTPMLDGTLDHMQTQNIRPMAWNPLGSIFREDSARTRTLKTLMVSLMDKYHVGSDTLLLAWVLKHPAKVVPVVGTVNIGRVRQLNKALELELEQEDWFAIWTESMGHKVP